MGAEATHSKDGNNMTYLSEHVLSLPRLLQAIAISAGAEIQMWKKSGHGIISSEISLTLNTGGQKVYGAL